MALLERSPERTDVTDTPAPPPVRPASGTDRERQRAHLRSAQPSVLRVAAGVLCLGLVAVLVWMSVFSRLQHDAAQRSLRDAFRDSLAQGTAPVGQVDDNGHILIPGTPVAILEIPSLRMNQVVGEGTTSALLTKGPGHLPVTVLPGEVGTCDIYGRRASYGGPFGAIAHLRKGDRIVAIDGIGSFTYRVIDVRLAGDPEPAPVSATGSRITLLTASGAPYLPDGVVRVDADLVGAKATPVSLYPLTLPSSELALGKQTATVWQLVLWLEALLIVVVGATIGWTRWGRAQTWIVFFPAGLLVMYYVCEQTTRLLPNLL